VINRVINDKTVYSTFITKVLVPRNHFTASCAGLVESILYPSPFYGTLAAHLELLPEDDPITSKHVGLVMK
jgi:hypothetical protein